MKKTPFKLPPLPEPSPLTRLVLARQAMWTAERMLANARVTFELAKSEAVTHPMCARVLAAQAQATA